MICLKRLLFFLFAIASLVRVEDALAQAQGTQTEFGKNRVQYKDFQWFYYRSPHFDTYYYLNGKELGAMVGKIAEQNLKEVENILDYKLEGRIKILSYNKLSDLKQTNLGLATEVQSNTGGVTQIVGNKLFVYFDGNTSNLRKQIRKGIAQILINEMLYGGNLQEKLSNATLLTLPNWFLPGLTSYIAEEWSVELDNELKDGILSGRYKKFNRLADNDARIAGHSIWKFVVDNYGLASISNIVYMTRVNRNAESGFIYIIGQNFQDLAPQWQKFYRSQYDQIDIDKTLPSAQERITHKKRKRTGKLNYDQLRVSPNGKQYAYLVNRNGRFSVYVYDLQTEKTKRVFRSGMKTQSMVNENSRPTLAWHPSSVLLAVNYEKKSMPMINVLNLNEKKESTLIKMYKYEKILDLDYSGDGRKWVLSAIRNGQSDLYVFDIPSRRDEQLTNDWFDDLQPRFIDNSNKIVFSSNRVLDSLGKDRYMQFPEFNNFDLFVYDYRLKDPVVKHVTRTPFINETNPVEMDTSKVAFLSDANGVINRSVAVFDSVVAYRYDTTISWFDTTITVYKDTFSTYPVSNYKRSIIDHDISKRSRRLTESIFNKGQVQLFMRSTRAQGDTVNVNNTPFRSKQKKIDEQKFALAMEKRRLDSVAREDSIRLAFIADSLKLHPDSALLVKELQLDPDKSTYYFQSDFPRKKTEGTREVTQKTESGYQINYVKDRQKENKEKTPSLDDYFTKSSPIPYLPEFSTSYVVSQIDNSLISNSYQQFTGVGPIYVNSSINALIKVGTADLMEDYRFTGGFRLAGNLTIPEYFLSFENLKKRLDKQFIFYKQGGDDYFGFGAVRTNSYEFKTILKWPFNEYAAVRASFFYRRDETIFLSTDQFMASVPNYYRDNIGYKLEYVFDNTIPKGLNLYNGTRYKFYVEQFKEVGNAKENMFNLGFDFRHYQKIHRQVIFASRVASSSSIAKQKVMYYLGGVDSWFIPRFNRDIQIDQSNTYKYQALATNMRGFTQNIRNGNNFAVINTEIRIPVFAYLLNRPIKSDFVKNFQVVPFGDVGAAWVGMDPFSYENRYNEISVQQGPPVTVKLVEPKYPIVGGFGWGLRSRLLGYFIRFDMSWGVQNSQVEKKPVYYVSLSLDF